MDNWDEIRTAFQVARRGTVSGAADELGVHHATVIRHIDALETRLGVKLFQRHARGYTPTEAGTDLLQVAQATDDQFSQLVGRIKGRGEGVSGELVVTALASMAGRLIPVLHGFQVEHPDLTVRLMTGERVFRLEYGEAHVAIRAGGAPNEPDNVVQPFFNWRSELVMSDSYIAKYGRPKDEADLKNHRFVGRETEDGRAPFNKWLAELGAADKIVFRATDDRIVHEAIAQGAGIGFVNHLALDGDTRLQRAVPCRDHWCGQTWLVTHVDLHRTAKVQAFLTFLKEQAKDWGE